MKLKGPATQLVDLKGRTLLPGFVDAHCFHRVDRVWQSERFSIAAKHETILEAGKDRGYRRVAFIGGGNPSHSARAAWCDHSL
jgi:cytosine/adenosine deaminase-related metal-dependent hydrolase